MSSWYYQINLQKHKLVKILRSLIHDYVKGIAYIKIVNLPEDGKLVHMYI